MTLVKTFSMMDRHRPAMMSPGSLPLRCSVTMLLFIKTVHRLPRLAGSLESKAARAIWSTGDVEGGGEVLRKDPQPEEQASLTTMLVMTPWESQMAFMSWPPMSSTQVALGTYSAAARAWATVSTTWHSADRALANSCSP